MAQKVTIKTKTQDLESANVSELEFYVSNLAAAGALLQLNEVSVAKFYLDKVPENLRDLEWNYLNNQLDQSVITLFGHEGSVAGIAVSLDGQKIASGSADKKIIIWNLQNGEVEKELKGHDGQVTTLAFTPDGKKLVSGSTDKTVKIWNINTGQVIQTISEGLSRGIYDVEISPDGSKIALGSWQFLTQQSTVEGFAKIYDLQTGKELKKYFMTPHPCSSIKFNSDGSKLVIGGWGFHIKQYDLNTDSLELDIDIKEDAQYTAIQSLALSPDNSKILVGCKDRQIRMFDTYSGELLYLIDPYKGHKKIVNAVAFIGNGELFASASQDNMIKVWETETGILKYELRGHTAEIKNLTATADGKFIISAASDGSVKIWDLESIKKNSLRVCDNVGPWAIPYLESENIMASTCGEEGIRMFTISDKKEMGHIDTETFYFMDIDPTGKYLATAYEKNSLTLWDVATQSKIKTGDSHEKFMWDVKFIHNSNLIATASADGTIKIYTFPDLTEQRTLVIGNPVTSLNSNKEGTLLAAGTSDQGVILWETKNWTQLAKMQTDQGVLRVKFSQDGKLLLSSGESGEVKLWDAKTFQLIQNFKGHSGSVNAAIIHPNNRRIVTGGDDYTIRFWDVNSGTNLLTLRDVDNQPFHAFFTEHGSTLVMIEKHGVVHFMKTSKE